MKTGPLSQTGARTLLAIMASMLLIAAVACSSKNKDSEPTPADPVVSDVVTNDRPADSGTVAQVDEGSSDDPAKTVADVEPDVAFEQATGVLFLEMISPQTDELFVTQSNYKFSGRTTVDALLSVNDHVLEVDELGRFAFDMDLEEGPNVIEVIASNATGDQYDEVLLVIYEPA